MVAGPALLPGADPGRDRGAKLAIPVEILFDQRILEPEQADLFADVSVEDTTPEDVVAYITGAR